MSNIDDPKYLAARVRKLTWQEKVYCVGRFHELMCDSNPKWRYTHTMKELRMSEGTVSQSVQLYNKYHEIKHFKTVTEALRFIRL